MMADYIQSIQIAPDGVVTEIYSEDGNESGIAMKSYIDYGATVY
jgi:sensor domain CHASE-containing protein